MSWKDKTVSMGLVDKEEFDLALAHVTVSENKITVRFKDTDDVERIRREVDENLLLDEVRWRHVEDVSVSEDHLYYPHINITIASDADDGVNQDLGVTPERRIYFTEDEKDAMERCLDAINRFWQKHKQRHSRKTMRRGDGGYRYQDKDVPAADQDVELEDALQEQAAAETDSDPQEEQETESEPAEDEDDESADASADETSMPREPEPTEDSGGEDDDGQEAAESGQDAGDEGGEDSDASADDEEIDNVVDRFMSDE